MVITTKYDVGDEVWAMVSNKPTKTKIISFNQTYTYKLNNVAWNLDAPSEDLWSYKNNAWKNESQLFRTKQELIDSL